MVSKSYKSKAKKIIQQASDKKMIKSYSDFYKTNNAKDLSLKEDEINYYISQNKGDSNND